MATKDYPLPEEWTDTEILEHVISDARFEVKQGRLDGALNDMESARHALRGAYPEAPPPLGGPRTVGPRDAVRITDALEEALMMLEQGRLADAVLRLERTCGSLSVR